MMRIGCVDKWVGGVSDRATVVLPWRSAMTVKDSLVRMTALAAVEVGDAVVALTVDVDGLAVDAAAEDASVLGLDDVGVEGARSLPTVSQTHFARSVDDIRMAKDPSNFPVALVSKMDPH